MPLANWLFATNHVRIAMAGKNLSRNEIDGKLRDLKQKLDNLRRQYEKFFVGSRERPPQNLRRQVERLVRELEQTKISNTSQRFRLRSLIQRFSSYRQKWNRIQRQIERGTYQPHQRRAQKRVKQKDQPRRDADDQDDEEHPEHAIELEMNVDDIDLGELQEEFEALDDAGELEAAEPPPSPTTSPETSDQSDNPFDEQPETAPMQKDAERIRKKQDELGLSSGTDKLESQRSKLKKLRNKLDRGTSNQGGSKSTAERGSQHDETSSRERRSQRAKGSTERRDRSSRRSSSDRGDDASSDSDDDESEKADNGPHPRAQAPPSSA